MFYGAIPIVNILYSKLKVSDFLSVRLRLKSDTPINMNTKSIHLKEQNRCQKLLFKRNSMCNTQLNRRTG